MAATDSRSKVLPSKQNQAKGSEALFDPVAILRGAEAHFPLAAALRGVGFTLLAVGLAYGTFQFLTANPYVLLIVLGIACLSVSLLAGRDGLIVLLPEGVQDLLLRKTWFDFMHDDSGTTNFFRRWARVLILSLQGGRSPGEIQAVIRDMDPDFLDMVLRRTFAQMLPVPVLRLLLPEASYGAAAAVAAVAKGSKALPHEAGGVPSIDPHVQAPGVPRSRSDVLAAAAAASGSLPCSSRGPPTAAWIAQLLKEKDQEKDRRIQEPELLPALMSSFVPWPSLFNFGHSFLRGLQALACAAAVGWGLSFGMFRLEMAQGALQYGAGTLASTFRSAGTSSRWAGAVCLLSAGASVALMAFARRMDFLLQETETNIGLAPSVTRGPRRRGRAAPRPFEPEREESPEDSEASPGDDDRDVEV